MQSTINEKAPSLKDLQDVEILPASVPAAPDSKTEEEIQDLTQQEADAKLERYKQDTGERKRYANRVYCLVSAWVAAIFIVVFLQGFGWFGWKSLGDTELTVLVGSSTISVFGILNAVVSNLFKSQ